MRFKHTLQVVENCFINHIPEGQCKNVIYYINHKLFKNNNFKTHYNGSYFEILLKDSIRINLITYEGISTFRTLTDNYFKFYTPKYGDVIIDAGAYVGEFTIYAAKIVGNSGKVIAFEPDKSVYEKLMINIKLNNLTNVIAINKGIWSYNCILRLNIFPSGGSSFILNKKVNYKVIELPVVCLDKELSKLNIDKVNFIKMDVEGAEIEALKGSRNVLQRNSVHLAVASYHMVDNKQTFITIEKMLDEMGYDCKTCFPEHLTTYALKK